MKNTKINLQILITLFLLFFNISNAQNNIIGIFDPLNMSQELQQSLNVISPDSFEVFNNINGNIYDYAAIFLFLGEAETGSSYNLDTSESQLLIDYLQMEGRIHICSNYLLNNLLEVNLWEFIGIESEIILLPMINITTLAGIENTIMSGIEINYPLLTTQTPILNDGEELILIGSGDVVAYSIMHQFESDSFKVLFSYRNVIHYHEILKRVLGYFDLDYVPVEFTSFSALATGNNVRLNWSTATEINNQGFEVERQVGNRQSAVGNDVWEKIGFVDGYGTTTEPKSYSYTDQSLTPGLYSYRLKQIDFDGSFEYSHIVEVELFTPQEYSLEQNYPNPFNPETQIEYSLSKPGFVTLSVFDILGNKITDLVNEKQNDGTHNVTFNASELSSGLYFYSIKVNDFHQTKKMLLVK
ncbi:MAG: T9SS type A sorting domain-containing protein [Ignavibacteriaceae bacterium]